MKENVSITSCVNYNQENLAKALNELIITSPIPEVKNKTVLLKPNILSDADQNKSITTNPEFLRAVIHLLKNKGAAKILVGDSPGLATVGFLPTKCGIYQVVQDEKVEWVDFVKDSKDYNLKIGKKKTTLLLSSIIDKVDFIFSLPKFKTHQLMYSTGAVKNLFGLVPGLHKSPNHFYYPTKESFAKLICEIYKTVHADYTFMDAIIGMEGHGPANGTPKTMNLILASSSLPGVDTAQAIIMGYKPMQIPIINELTKQKLFSIKDLNFPLLDPFDLIDYNFKRIEIKEKSRFFSNLTEPYRSKKAQAKKIQEAIPPAFNDNCIRCGRCIKICPAKALTMTKSGIKIDTNKCIRCYCCHEICPANAITIEKTK